MTFPKPNIAIIVLAAGSSTRLGTPKQLLPYKKTTLIRHIAQVALQSKANKVYVVTGFIAEEIHKELAGLSIEEILNPDWKTGISSTLRTGIKRLDRETQAAIIVLCDQPKITTSLLNTLIDLYLSAKQPIIACRYDNTTGVPALFDRSIFPELLALEGDTGAKQIIAKHASSRLLFDFPDGIYDIDSPDDSKSLR